MAHETAEVKDGKWRAAVTEVLPAKIDDVWAVVGDFSGIETHFPTIVLSCETVGERNKAGSLRKVTAYFPGLGKNNTRERLLTRDDVNHTMSYFLEQIDAGWTGFVSHVSCNSVDNGQTLVKWSYELDPISGQTEEEFIKLFSGFYVEVLRIIKGIVAK